MHEWIRPRGHDVAVLWSRRSRDAYAAEAAARGDTYTFTDAWGRPCTWLKGEYAYLAANAASLLLARCNLKHDVVEEADLGEDRLAVYRALLVPNAGHLAGDTIAGIERWLGGGDRRLVVTGKTNVPPHLLGLRACTPTPVTGYTGWRWRPDSPFAGPAWEAAYATGYAGHPVNRVEPAPGSRVLADLVEFTGDLTSAATATVTALGPGIVLTERTAYVANQVFELLGGMLQALLSQQSAGHAIRTRRTKTPGVMTFLEVPIIGNEHRFVERTIRIAPIPAPEAGAVRASIVAAIPARTGRVI